MIGIRELNFRYRHHGPEEESAFGMRIDELEVGRGSSTALVGPSGSGKTTLLGLIAGTLRPDAGEIVVNDEIITGRSESELGAYRVRSVGQVFQAFELLNYLTVIENVMLSWYIAGGERKAEVRDRAEKLLASVGLGDKIRTRPQRLSQGEQQRVAVCRAMLNDPPLLLADEPTGNLDQQNKLNVVDLLHEQAKRNDSTLLMVTHDESLLGSFDVVLDMRDVACPVGDQEAR